MTAQFDMFPNDATEAPSKSPRDVSSKRVAPATPDEESMIAHLASTGRYRILKKLEPRALASTVRPEFPLRGVILDTETTGLNHRKDEIIEIGAIAFTFDEQGAIGDVTGLYGGLQQPSFPIPVEITRLTGISDEMVAGKLIDMPALRRLIDPADLVVAHNAGFDRPFCEAFSPAFSCKAWACSNAEVDWSSRGFEGTKLGYLVGQAGLFHEGHRAVDDCFALLEVLARESSSESVSAFAELYRASQRSRVRIFAENSPFDMKDHLKARGYRWSDGSDGRPKCWWIELDEPCVDEELHFLRSEIYRYPDADPPTSYLTAFDRFKA
ncbi:3'-5' exonuclease [Rhizobium leguminosarum bv. viciae]|uniref:3'-5' exonuclease n=1 Tax=Rhizobium leguminosarum TaxID=384 RepID=A0A6P0B0T1_RHILE|nr:3'-5' exonuclease [Rhizobium leguminosarum]MBY5487102.1 3'-5' exonuclease [Rhizobium leguminosarum]NEI32554.1 3'-5' exonuclease [Rhizobium leguminosarum]NEI39313.1 3'-5' exonuclease [Rhizobium leguminosarum]TBZ28671.1 3'-5' exonuclease [Rhizobium leguminosarum bv. viciae]